MTRGASTAAPAWTLPDSVRGVLDDFRREFGWDLHVWAADGGRRRHLYPPEAPAREVLRDSLVRVISPRDGPRLEVELRSPPRLAREVLAFLTATLDRILAFDREVRFFTRELVERYEEINLLYFISETLGSILTLEDAARVILQEVADVMAAHRAALWVFDPADERLHLVAAVGQEGLKGPISVDDRRAVTARVFRERTPLIVDRVRRVRREPAGPERRGGGRWGKMRDEEVYSFLSVPIRYTPPNAEERIVGVVNLIGRRGGGRFTVADQKLLSAIASQIGAAVENNRLVRETLRRERISREMELAHDLQMKLLPSVDRVAGAEVAARCEPAELVGGDFYHLFRLAGGRLGVMIGDVSTHGFPAALIMALAMSAAAIYAHDGSAPAEVLCQMHAALADELENTEMYLTLFYGVLDPGKGELIYANAGHPHAFRVRRSGRAERLRTTDPPFAIAGAPEYHERRVPWAPGADVLLLFTDGLSDALAQRRRSHGERRVLEEVRRLRDRPLKELVDHLFRLARAARTPVRGDDRTAIVIRA